MADLLSKLRNNFTAVAIVCALICHGFFHNVVYADFSLNDFPSSNIIAPFGSKFSGHIPKMKKELTPEEKEAMRIAKEKLKKKGIPCTTEAFIKLVKKNKVENMELMLEAGISPNADYFGEYAIYYAARNNKTDAALLLLEKGADPNPGFDSPLWWAVKKNNITLVKALIEKGAKLDYIDLVSSKSLLFLAIDKGRYEIARMLIENGAKIDRQTMVLIEKKNLYEKLGVER